MKAKKLYLMAVLVIVVAVAIGLICLYTGDTKEVLEGTLVKNEMRTIGTLINNTMHTKV